jgi:hypothetical protein
MDIPSAPGAKAVPRRTSFPLFTHPHHSAPLSKILHATTRIAVEPKPRAPLFACLLLRRLYKRDEFKFTFTCNCKRLRSRAAIPVPVEGATTGTMARITAMAAAVMALVRLLPLGQAEQRPTEAHLHGLPGGVRVLPPQRARAGSSS